MRPQYKVENPQDFLDAVERAIKEREYVRDMYLVERDKTTLTRRAGEIQVAINEFAVTPVRGLRWDYLVGDDFIHHRQFIIGNTSFARYFIDMSQDSKDHLGVEVYGFKNNGLSPHLIQKHDLKKSKLDKKISLYVNFPRGDVDIALGPSKDDEFLEDVLNQLPTSS
jgi:hypothetical protein